MYKHMHVMVVKVKNRNIMKKIILEKIMENAYHLMLNMEM